MDQRLERYILYFSLSVACILWISGFVLIMARNIVLIGGKDGSSVNWDEYVWFIRYEWAPSLGWFLFLFFVPIGVFCYMRLVRNHWFKSEL